MAALRALALAALAAVPAAAQLWVGAVPGQGSVSLVELNDGGNVVQTLGTVALGAGEHLHVDAFRCLDTFCVFTSSDAADANSFVYNVSLDGTVQYRTSLPGILAHNVHLDHTSGALWTVALNTSAGTGAAGASGGVVTQVLQGVVTPGLDLSSLIGNGHVWRGATTHCSVTDTLYVAVDNTQPGAAGGSDILLAVDLAQQTVVSNTQLSVPVPTALWADCDTGSVGGIATWDAGLGRRSLVFFELNATTGAVTPTITAALPAPAQGQAPLELSGLLTASYNYTYVAPVYPGGAAANGTAAAGQGYLWVAADDADEAFAPLSVYLVGAACISC